MNNCAKNVFIVYVYIRVCDMRGMTHFVQEEGHQKIASCAALPHIYCDGVQIMAASDLQYTATTNERPKQPQLKYLRVQQCGVGHHIVTNTHTHKHTFSIKSNSYVYINICTYTVHTYSSIKCIISHMDFINQWFQFN